ncbi:MAG: putative toxin-antitoxin system toxin component, PIN family [Microcystis sp.]|jgi:putative PIN family toxin of toxin-antitoxin system|uniref:putative toxin-antitoxin system toxin component, PIN family n=1 Tax=unclassified Microcystis TaxID=2643300 RepID=UPI0018805B81|nr:MULTISPECIES: putative toxin-antitoxin system toxin component, PIN family [unclassified Microcystis]MBE5228404.1 putative toxin-antitoxin system toxin component, PIN family [Microcystis aeruginosa PMC 728.11]MCA2538665.1 putative toxin-antitoxin system toxin component, PIN family [Microcystis sp. M54BS1]MCA2597541.1 putative toxin-antitoxin system toxin component, PIN family [Microcystis sp. M38BS1]MCA2612800.1 putative toxin-antitoxin system toxin component, PIN family [Microcystis sp. M27B
MNKPRFVFDANVIVSAFLFKNSPPRLALETAKNQGIIILSETVIDELSNVLSRSKFDRYLAKSIRQELLETLVEASLLVQPSESIDECRDAKDNKYLELAISGHAESLITGDEDLLVLNPFRNIKIITVLEFLDTDSVS